MGLTIAQFNFGLRLGGQERVVVDLARNFQRRGHTSMVCTTMIGGELVDELASLKIPFHSFFLKKSYDPRGLLPAIRYLRQNRVDVVITHGASGCLIPRMASLFMKRPVFIHVEHNISDHKRPYQVLLDTVLSLFADKVVCISESAKRSLLKRERITPEKVAVIPNGLDTGRFLSGQPAPGKPGERPRRVGIVGRFMEQKGHVYFLEAAAEVVKTMNNVEFILVGDGALKEEMQLKAEALGLSAHCRFLGFRSDVQELLRSFDVFVLSSLWEGLPISLLEAQYFGVAPVVTDVGGIPEVITDGYNGLLVPPKDPGALAAAMRRVLADDTLRSQLAENGKRVFAERFTSEKMADSYLGLGSEILRAKGLPSAHMAVGSQRGEEK